MTARAVADLGLEELRGLVADVALYHHMLLSAFFASDRPGGVGVLDATDLGLFLHDLFDTYEQRLAEQHEREAGGDDGVSASGTKANEPPGKQRDRDAPAPRRAECDGTGVHRWDETFIEGGRTWRTNAELDCPGCPRCQPGSEERA